MEQTEGYNFDHDDCLSTTWGENDTSVSPIFIAAGKGIKENFKTNRMIRQVGPAFVQIMEKFAQINE